MKKDIRDTGCEDGYWLWIELVRRMV